MTPGAILRGEGKGGSALILLPAILVVVLVIGLLQDVLARAPVLSHLGELGQTGVMTLILFGLLIAAAVGWGVLTKTNVLPIGDTPAKAAGLGAAIGLGGLAMTAGYAWLAGSLQPAGHPSPQILLLLAGTVLTLFQCAAEEVYFRGWIQPMLAKAWGAWPAVLFTSLLFAGLHIFAGMRAPMSMLNVFLAGVLFGLLALRTGGLVAPVLAHFAWDWAESILTGLYPNPGAGVWNTIFNFDLAGSPLWGGSSEGLNGSLAETFVLMALCVPFAWGLIRPKPVAVVA